MAEMNELTKHQVQHGHHEVEIISKKTGLPTKHVIKVLREIETFRNFYCWVNADEYLDHLEEADRECEQRLMEKNNKLSLER